MKSSGVDHVGRSAFLGTVEKALVATALPGELIGFDKATRAEAGRFCIDALSQRSAVTAVVRIDALPTRDGRRRSRLVVVNDDMPFLVDSVAAAVGRFGLVIDRLLHPVVHSKRGQDGSLISLSATPRQAGYSAESLIYLEIERADARTRAALAKEIATTLAVVRAAVVDWQPMRKAMADDADELADDESSSLLRWFLDTHFTQLGACRFSENGGPRQRLGIARIQGDRLLSAAARARALEWFAQKRAPLLVVKSNLISIVHRRVPLDLIIVPRVKSGVLVGLSVHAGLWTSSALAAAPDDVPILRTHLAALRQKYGLSSSSHTGKALTHALTSLPHDLLVSVEPDALEELALLTMSLTDRPRAQLALLRSPLQRHIFAFVWLPRDELTTNRRLVIGEMLEAATGSKLLSWSINLGDAELAMLRYTLDIRESTTSVSAAQLNQRLELMVRGWPHAIEQQLLQHTEIAQAARLGLRYANAFPQSYRANHTPHEAAVDIMCMDTLNASTSRCVRVVQSATNASRLWLKIYCHDAISLSDVVPVLENFNFRVIEETQTALADGGEGYIYAFLVVPIGAAAIAGLATATPILETAIAHVLEGRAENDAFNKLIIRAGLALDSVILFRALFRYLRQTGLSYGLDTVVNALGASPSVSRAIIDLFQARHDPKTADKNRALTAERMIEKGLESVSAIDDDRLLRLMRAVIDATLRTNAFSPAHTEALAFKFDSAAIPGLPAPVPWREIFVYSPRVEGIHLRSGAVARGGLRWSDRRDDFRTEVLGLMKAQRVKNAVIVPTGAKGGFYPKQLPPAADRDAWLAEGTESYRIFIRALLSVTDNIVDGKVVHPERVVCVDSDDPYFVVAADKGTATFSDVANSIAIERDFWLGDAFASGGSNGYDHKAMGITAKGAWISVVRHFAEMGVDVQREPVRVVGCGDMSGDVFGNGMLLSRALHLVAAFDHRHIFIDPTPDAETSWAERKRLFALPRSSWADYDTKLISRGGGVFSRAEKSIKLSLQIRAMLGIDTAKAEPSVIIAAILRARVDLIWFGGIGTYIKATNENNLDVGDRANDAQRVDASEVRARVIGEGANLGLTQAARIEFAGNGGRINTDFIDNSAGVDCSDHEVNIKIALNAEVVLGALTDSERNKLLAKMTNDVAALVLEDNRLQTLALSIAEAGGVASFSSLVHLMEYFEARNQLDRKVEGIASNEELQRRTGAGRTLRRPELAVLMSTAKLALQAAVENSALSDDPGLDDDLVATFPNAMRVSARRSIITHQLRCQLIATQIANRMINRLGLVHPFELAQEEGATIAEVAEAFIVCERLFDMPALWHALDTAKIPEAARIHLFEQAAIEMRAHMADLLRNQVSGRTPSATAIALAQPVAKMEAALDRLLPEQAQRQMERFSDRLIGIGAPKPLAAQVVRLAALDGAVGIALLALSKKADPNTLTQVFTALGSALGIDWMQGIAMEMAPTDPWERLLAARLARDFHAMRLDWLARQSGDDPVQAVNDWLIANQTRVQQFRSVVDQSREVAQPSLAMFAQIAGQARSLLAR